MEESEKGGQNGSGKMAVHAKLKMFYEGDGGKRCKTFLED